VRKPLIVTAALLVLGSGLWFWQRHEAHDRHDAEVDRQRKIAGQILDAINRYDHSPNLLTQHDARIAIDRASEENLSNEKHDQLFEYWLSVDGCAKGLRNMCSHTTTNWISAMKAADSFQLDHEP